jgi:predicted site-specific integrase-resolvase
MRIRGVPYWRIANNYRIRGQIGPSCAFRRRCVASSSEVTHTTKGRCTGTGQRVGYKRVSTVDQVTDRQLDGISLDRVFTEQASGKNTERPELQQLIAYVRDGDTLVIHSRDRLARNLGDLRRLVRDPTGKAVRVEFVKEAMTFTGNDAPDGDADAFEDGRLRRIRASSDPRTPAGRGGSGQGARCLQEPQAGFDR